MGFVYPFFEGIAWNQHYGVQAWINRTFGAEFHDFAGSVVVHTVGGWIDLSSGPHGTTLILSVPLDVPDSAYLTEVEPDRSYDPSQWADV